VSLKLFGFVELRVKFSKIRKYGHNTVDIVLENVPGPRCLHFPRHSV